MAVFRIVGGTLAAALIVFCLAPAAAQTYPAHNVRMIVPFAAGGPTDIVARVVAQKLSEIFGQQIVVAPEIRERLEKFGFAEVANAPAEFGERLKTEMAKWGKVVRDAKIRAN